MTTEAPKKVYCTAPWNGLTIRENGDVRTCCVGQKSLGNINKTPIHEIQNSKILKDIQNTFKSNYVDNENCGLCVNKSKNSIPSLRDYYNRYYHDIDLDKLKLKVIDIRWSNNCNLQCMYCSPTFSNQWAASLKSKVNIEINQEYHDQVADWIIDNSADLRELMLVGGEPLLMKQNYQILKKIPLDTKISVITNLAYNLEELPCLDALLARSNSMVWNISMENIDGQFEYVRNKASWEQVEKNLLFLTQYFPNSVSVNFVYSMFSAFDITATFKKLVSLGIKKFNLMGIDNNDTMSVFDMPMKIKEQALAELEAAVEIHKNSIHPDDLHFYPIIGIEDVRTALSLETQKPINKKDFYDKIIWYNQWSDQKFDELWPHVMALVNLHLE
jgi:radical SAM protein with 4Fe4S-binding SPASM domain